MTRKRSFDFLGVHGEPINIRRTPLDEIVLDLDKHTVIVEPATARAIANALALASVRIAQPEP